MWITLAACDHIYTDILLVMGCARYEFVWKERNYSLYPKVIVSVPNFGEIKAR